MADDVDRFVDSAMVRAVVRNRDGERPPQANRTDGDERVSRRGVSDNDARTEPGAVIPSSRTAYRRSTRIRSTSDPTCSTPEVLASFLSARRFNTARSSREALSSKRLLLSWGRSTPRSASTTAGLRVGATVPDISTRTPETRRARRMAERPQHNGPTEDLLRRP